MSEYLPIVISAVCALLLVMLIAGMILNESFRNAVLGGNSEASVFGIFTVKGVSIIVLSGLFLVGLIYPLTKYPEPPVASCITKDNSIGRVNIQIGILNPNSEYHGYAQDAVRAPGVWLSSATQLERIKAVTSTWGGKRFGARWSCVE